MLPMGSQPLQGLLPGCGQIALGGFPEQDGADLLIGLDEPGLDRAVGLGGLLSGAPPASSPTSPAAGSPSLSPAVSPFPTGPRRLTRAASPGAYCFPGRSGRLFDTAFAGPSAAS